MYKIGLKFKDTLGQEFEVMDIKINSYMVSKVGLLTSSLNSVDRSTFESNLSKSWKITHMPLKNKCKFCKGLYAK